MLFLAILERASYFTREKVFPRATMLYACVMMMQLFVSFLECDGSIPQDSKSVTLFSKSSGPLIQYAKTHRRREIFTQRSQDKHPVPIAKSAHALSRKTDIGKHFLTVTSKGVSRLQSRQSRYAGSNVPRHILLDSTAPGFGIPWIDDGEEEEDIPDTNAVTVRDVTASTDASYAMDTTSTAFTSDPFLSYSSSSIPDDGSRILRPQSHAWSEISHACCARKDETSLSALSLNSKITDAQTQNTKLVYPTVRDARAKSDNASDDLRTLRPTVRSSAFKAPTLQEDQMAITRTDLLKTKGDNNGSTGQEKVSDAKGVLYIGGLFELSDSGLEKDAKSELDAALLGIRHVNEMEIVPGYNLHLVYNDSKCDAGVGTDVFYDLIYRMAAGRHITMVMGGHCSEVTKTLAEIVPYWNLILISYADTSPALGDREKYKTFFRLALADSALVPARRMFIAAFAWKTVAVVYEDIEMYALAINKIGEDFAQNNISLAASFSFKDSAVEIPEKLKELKMQDVRVILAALSDSTAKKVFCEVFRQKLFGPRYVWLLMGDYEKNLWQDTRETNCTKEQLRKVLNGSFVVSSLNKLLGGAKSIANLTTDEFKHAYVENNGSSHMSFFAATTYDTVWTIALTLKTAILQWHKTKQIVPPLPELNYTDLAPVLNTYIDVILKLNFSGVSGPVSFRGSDRKGVSVIYQLQDCVADCNFTAVAIHYPDSTQLDFNCDGCRPIVWQGGRVPRDGKTVVPRQKTIQSNVFYISTTFCGVGILLALVFLQYNLYHRKLKYIKLSSPKLNNVAVIGCILVYGTVVLMGLDDRTMPANVFSVVCSVRVFLLAAGFSLAFGAMFAKTFRVHQIFTRANHGLVKNKFLQDRHLLFIIGGLLIMDSGVIFVWIIVDPMQRHVTNLTMESSKDDEDLVFLTQLATCHSEHLQKWMGAFYAYKGLLLLFGVYMAWETRQVKIPALNDSQYIGFNVYNVVLVSVCVVVLSNILSSQPTLAYAIESAFMVLSTTVTLCLLFVPKIYIIVTSGGDPVIASTGILVEANTRRFIVDEKKEIYYRAEVQNRVYKRELVELDQEIHRLERLLELPPEAFPHLSDELMYLMSKSPSDGSSDVILHRHGPSSDGGDCISFVTGEVEGLHSEMGTRGTLQAAPLSTRAKRHSTQDNVSRSAFKKLRRLSRSLSIGHNAHSRWKLQGGSRLSGSGFPSKSDHHHWLSGCSTSRDSVIEEGDTTMSLSSSTISPKDGDEDAEENSKLSALVDSEKSSRGKRTAMLTHGNEDRSGGPRENNVTRLSLSSAPGANANVGIPFHKGLTRAGIFECPVIEGQPLNNIYRVHKLEIITMDDSLANHVSNTSLHGNACDQSGMQKPAIDALQRETNSRTEVSETDHEVGDSSSFLPQQPLSSGMKRKSSCFGKPCVHFAPDNDVRFLDSDVSDHVVSVAEDNSGETASDSTKSFVSEETQTTNDSHSYSTFNRSEVDSAEGLQPSVVALNKPTAIKTLIDHERRKRIRRLQNDLLRIQRELQYLDDLEYEVSEV